MSACAILTPSSAALKAGPPDLAVKKFARNVSLNEALYTSSALPGLAGQRACKPCTMQGSISAFTHDRCMCCACRWSR